VPPGPLGFESRNRTGTGRAKAPDMEHAIETRGHVLRGWSARFYDVGNAFFGVPLINRRHVSLIDVAPGVRLLDVGCGTAKVLEAVHRRHGDGIELIGVDPSPEMVLSARERLTGIPNAKIRAGVGERLPFAGESCDWVVSCLTTHHLPFRSKEKMIAECHRVLKPGGQLLISDFGPPRSIVGRFFARVWRGHSYTQENLDGAVRRIVRRTGFGDVRISYQGGVIEHLRATRVPARTRRLHRPASWTRAGDASQLVRLLFDDSYAYRGSA